MAHTPKTTRGRGQIVPRGSGKWLIRTFVGRNAAGKYKYASRIFTGTISQARQSLTGDLAKQDTGAFVAPTKQTVGEYLESWLVTAAKQRVTAQTYLGYRFNLEKYIIPKLGHHRLDRLTAQLIQAAYSTLTVSPRTVHAAHVVLKMALELAVAQKLLASNPATHAVRPRMERREEAVAFNSAEVDLFLETAQKGCLQNGNKSDPLYAMWLLFTATGVRPQEMFALTWEDLSTLTVRVKRDIGFSDTTQHSLSVSRAMVHVGKGKYVVGDVKTKGSKRIISIPTGVASALATWKAQQAAIMLETGPRFVRENNLVFSDTLGGHLDISNVRKKFARLCKLAKVQEIKLYGLRHTHATLLLLAGVPLKIVSERLGHSSIMLTADTYSHVHAEAKQETADTLQSILFRSA